MKQPGDFTAEVRLLWIALVAAAIGVLCAAVALVLQRLIFLFRERFLHLRHQPPGPPSV